jgi:hypothetical protein
VARDSTRGGLNRVIVAAAYPAASRKYEAAALVKDVLQLGCDIPFEHGRRK